MVQDIFGMKYEGFNSFGGVDNFTRQETRDIRDKTG